MVNKTEDNTITCSAQEPPGFCGSGDESCTILLAEIKVDYLAIQSHPYCVLVLFPLCFTSSKPPFPTEEATNGRLKSSGWYLSGLTPTWGFKLCCFQWEKADTCGVTQPGLLPMHSPESSSDFRGMWSWRLEYEMELLFGFAWGDRLKVRGKWERENSPPLILAAVQSLPGEYLGEKVPILPRKSVSKGQFHLVLISSFLLQQIPLKPAGFWRPNRKQVHQVLIRNHMQTQHIARCR